MPLLDSTPTWGSVSELASEIVSTLTTGISGIAQGIGSGLNTMVSSAFVDRTSSGGTTNLTAFGAVVVIVGGVALAVALTKFVTSFFTRGFGRG